jgi:hypothetical protein
MVISRSQTGSESCLWAPHNFLNRVKLINSIGLLLTAFVLFGVAHGQENDRATAADNEIVVNGVTDSDVFGLGQSVRIKGTVKQGAISFGGDVIVEGTVEGDVAAIGGSVIQGDGSRIGGDVIVLGGTYRTGEKPPNRKPEAMTIMYAGYQQELGELMRSPTGLLRPRLTSGYLGLRLLALLFWFIVSLALTAAMPGTISRGVTRLRLTSLRVAVIGVVGALVVAAGVAVGLRVLPQTISVLIGLMAMLLTLLAWLFGRVVLAAATGRWLQQKYFPVGKSSEAVALLLGTAFWVLLTSLPYIWPFVVIFIGLISLGLTLTARYRVGWRRAEASKTF